MARIVPVLDLSRLEQGASERRTFLFDLRTAARDVGFFYLSGHGISAVQIDEVLDASRRFFALPEADKLAIEMIESPQFRGYTRTGGELTRGKADWREQLDIGVERRPIPMPGHSCLDAAARAEPMAFSPAGTQAGAACMADRGDGGGDPPA
jgi:isopenicillin N synthase-like dioxygenase